MRRLLTCLLCLALPALGHEAQWTLDPHHLPLGDGRVSAAPRGGYVYACPGPMRNQGAEHAGDWMRGDSWDATRKLQVRGAVNWPQASFASALEDWQRRLTGNALPVGGVTGEFPIARDDPAYRIDRNPNAIAAQSIDWRLPRDPRPAAQPACVPMGPVGIMLNGVLLFNALDAAHRDAVAHEVQDRCNGHPERSGSYHYHGPSPCVPGMDQPNRLVGYARDGFGIFSPLDENGRELRDADLDACHGRVSRIRWDGKDVEMYHYVMTREYPYSIGCFRGEPAALPRPAVGTDNARPVPEGGRAPRQPPREAVNACQGLQPEQACRIATPRGETLDGQCRQLGARLACVPRR
ncbi:YHYH protein [Chromobacterium paludis]|uniref:YHYH protein n=1 Tax=Chromobacterium paludis TaxID=2605945 RepID=A0A5C1DMN9_9NEIS|nr:YHYH protein [Chromobacterium paludis]QEL57319.1 YHYH protein [Chromobacterium paludis]